jgi:hypothetical protein
MRRSRGLGDVYKRQIYNIDGYDQPKEELTDNEKIKLKYKLDLLTIFIYIFICILLFII